MAEVNPTDRNIDSSVDFSSMSSVLETISGVFDIGQKPATQVPPPLLLVGNSIRPGMSSRNLAARIISRLESDGGIPVGDIFADGDNAIPIAVRVISEEVVSMIQTEAKVEILIDPGAIKTIVNGTAGPYPVVAQGSNLLYVSGAGGVQ